MDDDKNEDVNVEISLDKDGNIDPISMEYNEYRSDLNKIYKATADNNSIVSKFSINNDKCIHELKIKYTNGTESIEKQHTFLFDEDFINVFLIPMINDYSNYNNVITHNIVLNSNGKNMKFIVQTKERDLLEIDNIEMDCANKFMNLFKKNNDEISTIKNEKGTSNILFILLVLIALAVVIGVIITICKID